MPTMTITEALAELKTIDKRIAKKKEFIGQYTMRQENLRDPLEKDGGSFKAIQAEMQAIGDLELNKVNIKLAIAKANDETDVTVNGMTWPISWWLIWKRDVAPGTQSFLNTMANGIAKHRAQALTRGVSATSDPSTAKPGDIIVNINEMHLAKSVEDLEVTLQTLDGQLSLKNATVTISW